MQSEARHLLHRYWYERVMLNFSVDTASLQRELPPSWRIEERLGGSNLTVGFCDVILDVDPNGDPRSPAQYLYVPVNGRAIDADGLRVNVRYLTLSDAVDAFPQCAIAAVSAEHSKDINHRGADVDVTERYSFRSDAYELELQISYTPGPATRYAAGMDVRCPSDPDLRQRYENEELHYDLRRGDVDRITSLSYRISGGMLSGLFDRSERLVSVIGVPTSLRAVHSD